MNDVQEALIEAADQNHSNLFGHEPQSWEKAYLILWKVFQAIKETIEEED